MTQLLKIPRTYALTTTIHRTVFYDIFNGPRSVIVRVALNLTPKKAENEFIFSIEDDFKNINNYRDLISCY